MKKILSLILAAVMLLSAGALTSCKKTSFTGSEPVVSTENFTVTQGMFAYYMNIMISGYQDSFEKIGIDPAVSLKEQECPYVLKGDKTWFNYFVEMTKEQLASTLALCQEAYNNGVTLSEEEMKNIDSYIADIAEAAKSYGAPLDEYVSLVVNNPFNAADLRKCLEMDALAAKYSDQYYNSINVTDEEAEKHYQDNRETYDTLDVCAFSTRLEEGHIERVTEEAARLAQAGSIDEYFALIRQFIEADYERNGTEITEEDQKMIDDFIASCVYIGMAPTDFYSEEAAEWSKTAKVGETYIETAEDSITVFLIKRELSRDESYGRNVRHVLFPNDIYDDDTIPQRVYNEWGEAGFTEEKIIELVGKYSQDEGSSSNGGLYTNVLYGDMVAEFNSWLFDESRKAGDHGIIETEFGWHLMYYVSTNTVPNWKSDVITDIAYEKYSAVLDKYYYSFEYDSEVIAGIKA